MSSNTNMSPNTGNDFDLKAIIQSYSKHWIWFVLSILTALILGYIFIRYSVPKYSATAKIQIIEEKNSSPQLNLFKDLDFLGAGKNKVEDEIEILNSRSNFIDVVIDLNLNLKIIEIGNIKDSQVYQEQPFKVNFIASDSIIYRSGATFMVDLRSESSFGFQEIVGGEPLADFKNYAFGNKISTKAIGDIVLLPNLEHIARGKGRLFKISLVPVTAVAQAYKKGTVITQSKEYSNILNLSLNDASAQEAKKILDRLIYVYNNNAIEDKKALADNTSNFINDRISSIYDNLSSIDQSAQDFKTERGLTDIASQANINMNVGAANQQELQKMSTQLEIANSMKDYVDEQDSYEVLPSNIGLADASIASTTAKYNQLVLERKRLLKSSNEKNPIIVNLDQQIDGLRNSMKSSLSGMTNSLNLQVNNLSSQMAVMNSRIYSSPKNERALRDITRQQQTKEQLYLYLLQKREESQITFASASPKSKVIDYAYNPSPMPVSPKKPIIYLASMIFGFLVPFSFIYLKGILDSKIHNKIGLEKLIKNIPVLAEIPKLTKNQVKMVGVNDRSVLGESLRILRTNLDYLLKSKGDGGKKNVVLVTSSVPGEGKTFVSSNLTMILANTGKRILLLGADIRNPKLYTFYGGESASNNKRDVGIGLTEYLYDKTVTVKSITNEQFVNENKVDVIYSGKIPPNPTELLMSSRMSELIEEVRDSYDYIILDSAPILAVTDTLLISEYADQILYVVKADSTEKKVLEYPMKLKEEGKLKNLAFVVNAVKNSDLGYGGKYGYGYYGEAQKKWWQFKKN